MTSHCIIGFISEPKGHMRGFLSRFRRKVISFVRKNKGKRPAAESVDDKIILGVLLWGVGAVAEADKKVLPEEDEKIKQILLSYTKISKQDFPIVFTAIRQASLEKIHLYRFVREVSKKLTYSARISIIEDLFCVAFADKKLDKAELEVIRKISDLFSVTERDFANIRKSARKNSDQMPRSSKAKTKRKIRGAR